MFLFFLVQVFFFIFIYTTVVIKDDKKDAVQMKAYSTCYSTGEHFRLRDVETLGSSVQIDKDSVCLLFVSRVNGLNARLLLVSSEDNRSCKHCSCLAEKFNEEST